MSLVNYSILLAEVNRYKDQVTHLYFFILLFLFSTICNAQKETRCQIKICNDPNTFWWTGLIAQADIMPLKNGYNANLANNYGNQVQPLLLSNRGHVIWSENSFGIEVNSDTLCIISPDSSLVFIHAGETLKDGYSYASKKFFPASGKLPDESLFAEPQYNTWIELMYDQNQKDILDYARQILNSGFEPGVFMIDDNWQEDYGKWDFHPGRFSNPKALVDTLHEMGFKVMLWICPLVSPDCDVFRRLQKERMLLEDKSGNAFITKWWNGYSGILDLSKDEANQWFIGQLDNLIEEYNIDGYKFDAGDFNHYTDCYSEGKKVTVQEHCEYYALLGLKYPLNEYRAMWKMGGQPIANRLRDKEHTWADLQKLIPGILLQGIMGYTFACPDLIGGGEFISFLKTETIDQDLIVRSAQCHALMPMMQFSVAPWRILDTEHLEACKKAVQIRKKFTPLILKLARESANTGEPIVRPLEYVFPHQGFAKVQDQFMLGENILIAPVVNKKTTRLVALPEGKWKDDMGVIYDGGKTITIEAGLDRLPYFKNLNRK
ncbi:glycoside hydrolase [Maribellus comscasis]|uniref:Glycoside hydrolase n=1 Tax=Maribellus comscasis TaxID=2681766 RepID=A0A6I6K445_9BACT|nr:glycoside hydrolase [Maribellus comscasis]